MKLRSLSKILTGMEPPEVREQLTENNTAALKRRRAIIVLSLVGLGSAAAASLLQTGVVKHLPDPPKGNFDADKVVKSDEAYVFGIPDATIALVGLAANVPIAAFGGANRVYEQPIVPILAAGKSAVEAAFAGWYFYQMPTKEKAWCGYCILGAAAYFSIFALALPEAFEALGKLLKRR
jgi:uncharacterized membrane protein